ncbi:hypothetical protein [Dyadobacter sp. BHUBP1]|uniref:hypothetical protein n=1 Tax=Dyadobacter sp. BHUBP1 TaxID=3424178 RepID=UPI003D352859
MKLAVLEADLDGVVDFGYLTIKSRLLFRFLTAKAELGHLWQAMLAKSDPFLTLIPVGITC